MPGKLFTPVSAKRRSAAHGCADAHTASAAHAVVGAVESASALAEIWRFCRGYLGGNKMLRNAHMRKLNMLKPIHGPAKVG